MPFHTREARERSAQSRALKTEIKRRELRGKLERQQGLKKLGTKIELAGVRAKQKRQRQAFLARERETKIRADVQKRVQTVKKRREAQARRAEVQRRVKRQTTPFLKRKSTKKFLKGTRKVVFGSPRRKPRKTTKRRKTRRRRR